MLSTSLISQLYNLKLPSTVNLTTYRDKENRQFEQNFPIMFSALGTELLKVTGNKLLQTGVPQSTHKAPQLQIARKSAEKFRLQKNSFARKLDEKKVFSKYCPKFSSLYSLFHLPYCRYKHHFFKHTGSKRLSEQNQQWKHL